MIRCTIVETTSQPGEAASRVARATVSEVVTLGRAAACKIYLPDPRVRLEHARMARGEDGYLYLEGVGGSVQVDNETHDRIRVAEGQRINLGPYEFAVNAVAHGPQQPQIQLTLQFTHKPAQDAVADGDTHAQGARRSVLNMRSASWSAVLLALAFLLVLPLWQAYQAAAKLTTVPQAGMDQAWNPGPISAAHQPIGNQCRNCHTQAFERVKDADCTHCHKNAGPHITAHPQLQSAIFGEQRCATCHREHQGEDGMKKVDAVGCAQCHGDIKSFTPSAELPDVGDFGKQHPEFRLSMRVTPGPNGIARRVRTPDLKEDSGLKFSHAQHLSPKGIKSPIGPVATGGRVVLECGSCHQLDSAKVRFAPIRMEKDCQGCHRLGVDPQYPTRQVPHAAPESVVTALQDLFASLALEQNPSQVVTVNSLLQGPQIQAAGATTTGAARWVAQKTQAAAKTLFEDPKGACKSCHTIEHQSAPEAMAPWKVQPVLTTSIWLPKARFSHAQHANAACTSCHEATTSRNSTDVLIPAIDVCRHCHTGTQVQTRDLIQQDKVASGCNLCHSFHAPVVHVSFKAEKARLAASAATGSQP